MELESESEDEENGTGENGTAPVEERSHIMEELWAEGNPFADNKSFIIIIKLCVILVRDNCCYVSFHS